MAKLLVTGGAGFIGSAFIKLHLKEHPADRIINLDKLTYAGNLKNLLELEGNSRYEFVQGDINDGPLVREVMGGCDGVINFAAETHVDRSIKDPTAFLQTNFLGVYQLLEAVRELKIKRFVHISTDEVYGSIEKGSFDEEAPIRPNSPYSAAKASAELLVRSYWVTYHQPVLVVRSCNNYGPYQYPEKVIPLFITNLIEGKKVPLYAKGENIRDWIFVEDNCRGIELVLEKGQEGEAYNIPADSELSNIELTRKILKAFSKGEDSIQYVADRPGHDFRYSIDGGKIRKLGFAPRYNFEQGIEKTVAWYRQNENWWMPLKNNEFTVK